MPDPFSITTGVVGLLRACASVGWHLKEFQSAAKVVDKTVEGLVTDLDRLCKVLNALQETARIIRGSDFQETGHIGTLWRELGASMAVGKEILEDFQTLLGEVGKRTGVLNKPRMQLRYYIAVTELESLRQRLRSLKDTVQLNLSTIVL